MADVFTSEKRSAVMSRIRGRDTQPELQVRRLLHRLGFRFRLQRKDLPGRPDLVLPKHNLAVFVHGCFWHQHSGCRDGRAPRSNIDFWGAKLRRNVERDAENTTALRVLGWRVMIIWECELKDLKLLTERIRGEIPNG